MSGRWRFLRGRATHPPKRLLLNLPKLLGRKPRTLEGLCLHTVCGRPFFLSFFFLLSFFLFLSLFLFFFFRAAHWSALEHFWTQWAPLVWLPTPCHGSDPTRQALLFLPARPPCFLICVCRPELESNISMCQFAFPCPAPSSVRFIYTGCAFFWKCSSAIRHWQRWLGLPLSASHLAGL